MDKPARPRRYIFLIIWLCSTAFGQVSTAQTGPPLPHNFVYRTWNNESGLPQNTVYDMAQDSSGYLWGATEEGLFRFDGTVFTVINQSNTGKLSSHTFYDLLPVGKDLWASGRNNLMRIHNKVERVYELGSRVSGGWIRCIEKDRQNRIWIGTSNGRLFYLENDSIRRVQGWQDGMGGSIETMLFTADRGMVIGTTRGIYTISGIRGQPSIIKAFTNISITAIIPGPKNELWIGTAERGIYKYTTDTVHYTRAEGLTQNNVNSLSLDKKNRLWIGFQSGGYQLMESGRFITPAQEGHDHDGVRSILPTGDQIIWMGTNSSGLVQIRPAQVTGSLAYPELSGKIVLGVYQHPSGEIWVTTAGRGVFRILDGKVTELNQSNGLSAGLALSVTGRGDFIYIGTNAGLDRFNRKTGTIDKHYYTGDGLQNNSILGLLNDSRDRIWIATRLGGLQRLGTDDKISSFPLPVDLGQSNIIGMFEDSKGKVWIGTRNSGMLCINTDDIPVRYNQDKGLMAEIVYSFFEDRQGDIWIGSDKGLISFSGGKFQLFSTESGLRFNEIYRILEDPKGYVWLSGNLGLQRVSLNDLMNAKNYGTVNGKVRTRLFNVFDGMPNSETNGGFYPAGWHLQDGTLWFPTASGVAVVNDKLIYEEPNALDIHVQSLRYADQELFYGSEIKIPPGVFNFEIRYTSIDFSKASDIRFFYRLKGFSEEWTEAGNRHVAYFSALEPGSYEFEVKAERYGYFSPTATMPFTIRPYFYQAVWFKLLMVTLLLLGGLAVVLYFRATAKRRLLEQQRVTMAQIHGQEKERQFISAELHDSVNQQLTTAKLFLDFAKSNEAMSLELMAKSEAVIQSVINNIRTLCNSLTPPSLKDIGLKEALEDLILSYTSVSKFELSWNFDIDPSELSEELQFTLFRITQEQMQNVVRHSACNNVWLDFSQTSTHLVISIRDDGQGFDPRTQRYGLGFENIKNRLILYNGKIDIRSAPGKGCNLIITLPIRKKPER